MSLWKIERGAVYDPARGVDGVVQDLWIEGSTIVAAPSDPDVKPVRTLSAEGMIVFPGGVDMHCHLVGPKVNVARKLRPEERQGIAGRRREAGRRSGTVGSVPTSFSTGYLYAGMGYSTAVDAAIAPLYARAAHLEFGDLPIVDKAFLILVGNNHYLMERIKAGDLEQASAYAAWLLGAVKSMGLKVVNPGGVEEWKTEGRKTLVDLDDRVDHFDISPRQILIALADVADRLRLPHPVHVHCNNLGLPGNHATTMETMRTLEGRRAHLAHIQFHSYGGGPDDVMSFRSRVPELVDFVDAHPSLSVDVGHVTFGSTTSLTGDGPLGHYLHKVTGNKWYSGDTEMETGCGVVPIEYKDQNLVNAVQWAIGLEWYLLMKDPWRIAMSTDHPNGGSFLRYPETIACLMNKTVRDELLSRAHPKLRERSVLGDIDREYTLSEIAILTRAAPARLLGLSNKGRLGPGADADITIYSRQDDVQRMFQFPRYVIKAGSIVVEDGEPRAHGLGETLFVEPPFDPDRIHDVERWFKSHYTVEFENYRVALSETTFPRALPLR